MEGKGKTYFDAHADSYADRIMAIQRTFYENSARLLNARLPENGTVLDMGNGGVINYDHRRLKRLDCADIVVSPSARARYADAPNIRFMKADVLDLGEIHDESYDAVILQAIIHHLAAPTYPKTLDRVRAALGECTRVLKPGGRLLVVESTVKPWFQGVERALFPAMELFFRLCRFGCVYQFSPASLRALLAGLGGLTLEDAEMIDVGPSIWLMGRSVPTRLTPCGACFYALRKGTSGE